SSHGILRWAYHGLPYYISQLFLKKISPTQIIDNYNLEIKGLNRNIPKNASIYNLPYLYRVSQAYAAISKKNLQIDLDNFDVMHLTLPLPISVNKKKTKKVVTVHDVIPLKFPSSTSVNLKHYHNILTASLADADLIFTVSEKSKNDLMEFMNIPDKKIHVTYQSSFIPDELKKLSEDRIQTILERYNLKYKNYFIFYGAIEPKKNVLRLLQAFSKARTNCKLVVLGKNGWLFENEESFFKSNKTNKIVRINYSDFYDMMTLLKGSKALIFPSIYEGFGLPVLEAMQMNIPVITSNSSCLPEVAGNAARYVDPYSISEIIDAIEDFSNTSDLSAYSEKGLKQAEKFSEENYQKRLREGYNMLFKQF
ncbi:glycosyltransferase family 4 protein, partial [Avibacterium avium]